MNTKTPISFKTGKPLEFIENGNYILLWLLFIICATDISSYILGNLIKGPKIFPILSPSKTYSGTFLGLFFGTLFGFFFAYNYLNFDKNLPKKHMRQKQSPIQELPFDRKLFSE